MSYDVHLRIRRRQSSVLCKCRSVPPFHFCLVYTFPGFPCYNIPIGYMDSYIMLCLIRHQRNYGIFSLILCKIFRNYNKKLWSSHIHYCLWKLQHQEGDVTEMKCVPQIRYIAIDKLLKLHNSTWSVSMWFQYGEKPPCAAIRVSLHHGMKSKRSWFLPGECPSTHFVCESIKHQE